jgi:hypothetical protein
MAYPFAYSERDLLDLFNNSNFILKEVYVEIIINHRSKRSYCSMFCVLNENNYNNINNICLVGYHRQFLIIMGLQTYCQFNRCMKCSKYLTLSSTLRRMTFSEEHIFHRFTFIKITSCYELVVNRVLINRAIDLYRKYSAFFNSFVTDSIVISSTVSNISRYIIGFLY